MARQDRRDPIYNQLLPPRVRKGDLMKMKIIEACITSISKNGCDGFNFNLIGKAAGISRAHVAHYFPEKIEMLELALQFIALKAQALTIEKIRHSADARLALRAVVDAAIENLETHSSFAPTLILAMSESTVNARLRAFHSEIRNMGSERIAEILKSIPELKEWSAAQRRVSARQIQAMIIGRLVHHHSVNGDCDGRTLRREIWASACATLGIDA